MRNMNLSLVSPRSYSFINNEKAIFLPNLIAILFLFYLSRYVRLFAPDTPKQ